MASLFPQLVRHLLSLPNRAAVGSSNRCGGERVVVRGGQVNSCMNETQHRRVLVLPGLSMCLTLVLLSGRTVVGPWVLPPHLPAVICSLITDDVTSD